jgi:hypothetical protein
MFHPANDRFQRLYNRLAAAVESGNLDTVRLIERNTLRNARRDKCHKSMHIHQLAQLCATYVETKGAFGLEALKSRSLHVRKYL